MSLPFWKGGLDGSQRSIFLHPPAAAKVKVKLQLQIPGKTVGLNMRSREGDPIFIRAGGPCIASPPKNLRYQNSQKNPEGKKNLYPANPAERRTR